MYYGSVRGQSSFGRLPCHASLGKKHGVEEDRPRADASLETTLCPVKVIGVEGGRIDGRIRRLSSVCSWIVSDKSYGLGGHEAMAEARALFFSDG